MNKTLLIILATVVVLILLILGGFFIKTQFFSGTPSNATSTNPFGFDGGQQNGTNMTPSSSTLPLVLNDGTVVNVPDFTKENQPSWAGETGYQVAGGDTDAYLITYVPPDQSGARAEIGITIQSEPLGATRAAAEVALQNKLQLNNAQICALNIEVYTQPGLSDLYEGDNLGVSFCPGAVKLP
jgi:hypothetical protein